jgi:hypothetical protein
MQGTKRRTSHLFMATSSRIETRWHRKAKVVSYSCMPIANGRQVCCNLLDLCGVIWITADSKSHQLSSFTFAVVISAAAAVTAGGGGGGAGDGGGGAPIGTTQHIILLMFYA